MLGALPGPGDDPALLEKRSAYVFTRSGDTWSQQAELIPSDAPQDDGFAYSVAIAGDTIAVGAPLHDQVIPPQGASSGAVYVFTRTNGEWTQQARLTAAGADFFGASVAISEDTLVVGAPLDDFSGVQSGSIYVFTRSGGTWSTPQRLEPSPFGQGLAFFGDSVAIHGGTIVSGALNNDGYGRSRGAVHVFTSNSGVWSEQQKLTASDTRLGDRFGASVAISENTVVVGAPFGRHGTPEGVEGGLDPGAAYVFTRKGGVWAEQQKLTPAVSQQEDRFGAAVAAESNTIVIGSSNLDSPVYAFTRSGNSWSQPETLTTSSSLEGGNRSLSIADATAVVRAPYPEGAYVFDIPVPESHPIGLVDPTQGRWHLRNSAGAVTRFFFGNPGDFPIMGDWDCDGIDTPGLFRTSDAFAYLRNSSTPGIADIRFFFGDPSDVPLAGDWNGDGCDTLSIYRPDEQRFYIVNRLGEDEGRLGAADFSFSFGNPGDRPVVGDWDGNGIDEVGLHRESTGFFYWRNTLSTGNADGRIFFGDPNDRFVAGDWGIVDGVDTPVVFRPSDNTFYFRHTLTQGVADSQVTFGEPGWLPVAGEFGLN